mgnify:CR=1 FL=1
MSWTVRLVPSSHAVPHTRTSPATSIRWTVLHTVDNLSPLAAAISLRLIDWRLVKDLTTFSLVIAYPHQ